MVTKRHWEVDIGRSESANFFGLYISPADNRNWGGVVSLICIAAAEVAPAERPSARRPRATVTSERA